MNWEKIVILKRDVFIELIINLPRFTRAGGMKNNERTDYRKLHSIPFNESFSRKKFTRSFRPTRWDFMRGSFYTFYIWAFSQLKYSKLSLVVEAQVFFK